jgi:hypothetical protein
MATSLLNLCSFAHTDPAQVIAGQVYSFSIGVPATIGTTGLPGTVLGAATAATVVWRVADSSSNPLTPGNDYQIVSGGLNQTTLAFVVNPSRTQGFTVQPVLTVAGGGGQVGSLGQSGWGAVSYTPVAANAADLQAKAVPLLQAALQLTTSANLIQPGAAVTLKVVETAMTSTPQIVTNLVHELPDVKIRGAIPLGEILKAIIGPIAGAISSALPSSTDSVSGEVGDVANLLAEALAIPIAVDVGGRKVTRTLAPLTTDLVTTVTSAPDDAHNLSGTVPIDGFLASFSLTRATWTVVNPDGTAVENINASPGLDLVRTLLLLPDIVALEFLDNQVIPAPVEVKVELEFELSQLTFNNVPVIVPVTLGPLPLLRLPLILPQIAAVFRNPLDDWNGDGGQRALLTTDSKGAKLIPSLDAMIRLLSALSAVLDTFTKAAVEAGTGTVTAWGDILGLGEGVRLLVALLGRIPQSKIYFKPTRTDSDGVDRADLDSETISTDDWDDRISAVIHIGKYAKYIGDRQPQGKWFRLADTNGPKWIDFNNPNQVFSYISVVSNLNVNYDTLKHSYPPHTADTNHPGSNLNDILERLEFRSSF